MKFLRVLLRIADVVSWLIVPLMALAAFLLVASARAGHVDLTAQPPWQNVDGTPANLTGAHYEWQVGCGVPGRYELGTRVSPTAAIKIDALPDSGLCYFRVTPVLATGLSGLTSDEAIFDFDRQLQIPSTPLAGPTVTWSVAPPGSRCVRLVSLAAVDSRPWAAAAEIDLLGANGQRLARTGWTATADSQEPDTVAGAVLDGNAASLWVTQWRQANPPHPHRIDIDLGTAQVVRGLEYLPRQGSYNGTIVSYEIHTSPNCTTWTKVTQGTWPATMTRKSVSF